LKLLLPESSMMVSGRGAVRVNGTALPFRGPGRPRGYRLWCWQAVRIMREWLEEGWYPSIQRQANVSGPKCTGLMRENVALKPRSAGRAHSFVAIAIHVGDELSPVENVPFGLSVPSEPIGKQLVRKEVEDEECE
jgi:hypothetical protein